MDPRGAGYADSRLEVLSEHVRLAVLFESVPSLWRRLTESPVVGRLVDLSAGLSVFLVSLCKVHILEAGLLLDGLPRLHLGAELASSDRIETCVQAILEVIDCHRH